MKELSPEALGKIRLKLLWMMHEYHFEYDEAVAFAEHAMTFLEPSIMSNENGINQSDYCHKCNHRLKVIYVQDNVANCPACRAVV